ncbi:MAG TPA: hypothetical protein VFS39_00915 [Nitrospira sp.]|nr:hypothetical protein [Nitrospira sp.]
MPRYGHILIAVPILVAMVLSLPDLTLRAEQSWVDRIGQRLQAQLAESDVPPAASERYAVRLQSVRQAVEKGQVMLVQREMSELVRMVATREGGINDAAAQMLLFYISQVAPSQYLDQTTKSHLRIIRDLVTFKAEVVEETVPEEGSYGLAQPSLVPTAWPFGWIGTGRASYVITLGAGILVLILIGAIAMLLLGLRGPSQGHR